MWHLLFPLLASLLFVCSLICVKRTSRESMGQAGVGPVTSLFFCNIATGTAFSVFWTIGGTIPSPTLLWQPLLVGALFVLGLAFTFAAITIGDVSIATPIFGVKVLFVAMLLTVIGQQTLPASLWVSAALAAAGIGLIQWTGASRPRHAYLTIVIAASASLSYAHFDVLVQRWSPAWGTGRFLPIAFACVAVLSLLMAPWVQWRQLRDPSLRRWLALAAFFMTLQSMLVVFTLATFGDAARVNIVFALRGLWSVGLAYAAARIWGGGEADLSRGRLATRFAGATLLTTAVVLAIAVP